MWNFDAFKDRLAFLTDDGLVVSYGELARICEDVKQIIPSGKLILHVSSNTLGSFVGYAALLQANHAAVLIEDLAFKKNRQALIQKWNPGYIWAEAASMQDLDWQPVYTLYNYTLFVSPHNMSPVMHKELALILTTSGSTANVKYVRQSFQNIRANTAAIVSYLPIRPTDRTVNLLPLHYTYGLSVVNTHLKQGASILVTSKKIAEKAFWDLIKKFRITNLNGVPFHYAVLMQFKIHKEQTHDLRFFTQAGGKLPENVQRYFGDYCQNTGIPLYIIYGQTEATARISYLPPHRLVSKIGSAGKAIDGVKITLRNQQGDIVEKALVQGEIHVAGANVAMGYAFNSADLGKGYEFGDWLSTGDIGYFDTDGYLYITGRKDRQIKLHGKRINLDELEQQIMKHLPEIECKCTAKQELIELTFTGNKEENELHQAICKLTGLHPLSIKVKKIDAFKRNSAGKPVRS